MEANDRSTLDVLRGSRILAYTVGIITLAAGIVLLFWPDRTVVVVARLAGILIAVVGLGEVIEAVTNRRRGSYWGWLLLRGAINVGIGLVLLFWPDVTVQVVVWLFGLNLIITGILGLIVAFQVPPEQGRSSYLIRAVVAIVLGVLVVVWPDVTLWVITVLIAIQLILFGLVMLWSGYALTRAERDAL